VGVVALVGGALLFRQTYGFVLLKDGWRGLVDHPGTFFRVMSHSSATTVIAVAVVPAVALLACLVWLGAAEGARGALAAVAAGFVVTFVLYTGLKSASQGFVFITRVEERNLIYLEAIALVALAATAGRLRARTLIVPAT